MIGCAGATFVTNQFWCSLMFAPNVVGTANATAAGWGNLGGGVTQIFMVWCLFKPFQAMNMSDDTAWRCSMIVPGIIFLLIAMGLRGVLEGSQDRHHDLAVRGLLRHGAGNER